MQLQAQDMTTMIFVAVIGITWLLMFLNRHRTKLLRKAMGKDTNNTINKISTVPYSCLPRGWRILVYTGTTKPASKVFSKVLDKIEVIYARNWNNNIWVQVTDETILEPYHIYYIKQRLPKEEN